MNEVKTVDEKEEKELKEQLTWEILGIIFTFIPFLDELTVATEACIPISQ
jgi:glucan 1,3-beta-glucosidase